MIHLRPTDYRVMPWKDGGGVTTELAIEPVGAGLADAFVWRLSSAAVAVSGPFSRFPGRLRDLVLLDGAGFSLVSGGRTLVLDRFDAPIRFSGDDDTMATLLGGGCIDLGLIWDPQRVRAQVTAKVAGREPMRVTAAPTTLVVAPKGGVRVEPGDIELGPMEILRLAVADGAVELRLVTALPLDSAPVVGVWIWPSV